MKYIFFSILSALAFSCGHPAETPKKRSLECYVRFLQTEGQIRAEAVLREGDTIPQPIEVLGGIKYQGKDMGFLPARHLYLVSQSGGFDLKHVFSWKDEQGKTREFAMQMAPIVNFGFGSKTLSRKQIATFRWDGSALEKGEVLVFLWENSDLNQTLPWEIFGTGGLPEIEIPAAKISELAPGKWTLYLVRKKLTKSDADGMPAAGIIEFYSKTDTLQVQ